MNYICGNKKEFMENKKDNGKNIRFTSKGWDKIRKYCFKNNLKMGAFAESAALEKISAKIKEGSTSKQQNH